VEFAWTDEQLRLKRAAAEFGAARLADGVVVRDREGGFSRELWRACAEFGLQGMLAPPAAGGAGYDLVTAIAILEGLGYGGRDNGAIFSVTAHLASCVEPLATFGTEAQKAAWLPDLASGAMIGATAITEPDTGSNVFGLTTAAVERDGGWVLSGSKTFVTNAPVADLFLVYARTGGPGMTGITCFLVPSAAPGLVVGPPIEKMGLRTSPMALLYLDGCAVPGDAVLGGVNSGGLVFAQAMEVERLLVMAPAIGVMERLLERTVAHARQRSSASGPIGRHQAVSHRVADMEMRLDASRLLLYRAAWTRMARGAAARESAMAKLAVSEHYVEHCRSAMQIFGGYGYTVDYELERELRDALATTLYVGTSEIQRNLIAGLRGLG
jgi:alkylation response protein AidB-like acyl-CoA dehydrogenase